MAGHPLVIDPQDPLVERLRAICLAYPESVEVQSWGRPTFRASKVFLLVSSSMDRPYSIVFKPDPDDRPALEQDPRFFNPPYWGGKNGFLAIDFDSPDTDWAELAELIDASYRQVALVRQLRALDEGDKAPL